MSAANIRPDLATWVEFLSVWLVGSVALIVLAAGIAAFNRRAAFRLSVWRVAFVLLVILPVAELFGLPSVVKDWFPTTPSNSAAENESTPPALTADPLAGVATASPALWPVIVWGAGVTLLLGRVVFGQLMLLWLRRRLPPANAAVRERAAAVARRCGYEQAVRVVTSAGVRSPYVFGLGLPILAVPADFEDEFTPAQQDAILAHEFGHLLNRDPLWHLIATLTVVVTWWNPLVWWARRRHEEVAEVAADETTLRVEDGPRLLAECLVLLGQRLTTRAVVGSLAVGGRRSNLARRVHRLLDLNAETASARRRLRVFLVAVVLAGALFVTMTTARSDAPWRSSLAGQTWATATKREPNVTHLKPTTPEPRVRTKVGSAPKSVVMRQVEPRSDEAIMAKFQLSDAKMSEFRMLRRELDVATREMYALPRDERVARGLEINKTWRAGLQRILTPVQYQQYAEYWRDPPTVAAPMILVPVKGQPGVQPVRTPVAGG